MYLAGGCQVSSTRNASQTVNLTCHLRPYGWIWAVFNISSCSTPDSSFFQGKGIKTEINGILPLESFRSQGFAREGGGRLETISRDLTKVSKIFTFDQKYLKLLWNLKL